MRRALLFAILLLGTSFSNAQNWGKPVWQDGFNQPPGSQLDPTKWSFDLGNLHVNNEVEIYCPGVPADAEQSVPRSEPARQDIAICDPKDGNVSFDGQHLVLRAVHRNGTWTSGRIKTLGHQAFQYGRIEASMKLPFGAGIWPAFWALGENILKVGWPASGEIDIMESVPEIGGLGPARIRSTVHGPGYSGDYGVRNDLQFPAGQRVDTAFHTYGALWSPYLIQFYLDDPKNVFFTMTPHQLRAGQHWVYNEPFFLIANLAIGSEKSWSGAANDTTPNPAEVLIDYVRVYKAAKIEGPTFRSEPATLRSGGTASTTVKLTAKPCSGKMYLDCVSKDSGVGCQVQPYVVDFSEAGEASVNLLLTAQPTPIDHAEITLTAYTLSGDQSSSTVKVQITK